MYADDHCLQIVKHAIIIKHLLIGFFANAALSAIFNFQVFAQDFHYVSESERRFKNGLAMDANHPYNLDSVVSSSFDQKITLHDARAYKEVNINEYPAVNHQPIPGKISQIVVGQDIPDEVLNIPLRVKNDSLGREFVTLRELSKSKYVVLDFWARWCSPCVASMKHWEDSHESIKDHISVLGVNIDYDFWVPVFVERNHWKNSQIIGQGTIFLAQYFLGQPLVGPSVWIKDGKFFGVTKARLQSYDFIDDLIAGRITTLPAESINPGYEN